MKKTLKNFKPGNLVIYKYQKYSCDTRNYTPATKIAVVIETNDLGVRIETERGQNPDYNIWIGCKCLDNLEIVGVTASWPTNVISFRRR